MTEDVAKTGDEAAWTRDDVLALLTEGELRIHGRLDGASNAVLHASVSDSDGRQLPCVYKPVAGERPLWDFPDGTLAQREVAAFEVCRAMGWDLIPPTVLRHGPHGQGMCQQWIGPVPGEPAAGALPGQEQPASARAAKRLLALVDGAAPETGWKAVGHAQLGAGRTALLVHADNEELRRLAALDAVINNGDRKGGHLLALPGGPLRAIDHGVSFHTDDKLRTLLWGWAGEPLPPPVLDALRDLRDQLAQPDGLVTRMAELITSAELAALRERTATLLISGRHPLPSGEWPAIPWPLV